MLADRYGGCAWETFGSAGFLRPVLHTYVQLPPFFEVQSRGVGPNSQDLHYVQSNS